MENSSIILYIYFGINLFLAGMLFAIGLEDELKWKNLIKAIFLGVFLGIPSFLVLGLINFFKYIYKIFDVESFIDLRFKDKEDLMQDFISIITSFCARIYSRRRTKNQVKKIIQLSEKE